MTDIIKILAVEPLAGYAIRVSFSDGAIKDIDLTDLFTRGGVFEPIRADRSLFERVRVNPESETVEWPDDVDLDPDVLYGRYEPASGARIERRVVREPAPIA